MKAALAPDASRVTRISTDPTGVAKTTVESGWARPWSTSATAVATVAWPQKGTSAMGEK